MAKILVVDDERILVEAYQLILQKEGHKTKPAYDGQEALEVAKSFKPDLILLDLLMPKMGGIDFMKAYKPKDQHPEVKIIVFSNLDMSNEAEDAYELGAYKYILKAWATPKTLAQLVEEALS